MKRVWSKEETQSSLYLNYRSFQAQPTGAANDMVAGGHGLGWTDGEGVAHGGHSHAVLSRCTADLDMHWGSLWHMKCEQDGGGAAEHSAWAAINPFTLTWLQSRLKDN